MTMQNPEHRRLLSDEYSAFRRVEPAQLELEHRKQDLAWAKRSLTFATQRRSRLYAQLAWARYNLATIREAGSQQLDEFWRQCSRAGHEAPDESVAQIHQAILNAQVELTEAKHAFGRAVRARWDARRVYFEIKARCQAAQEAYDQALIDHEFAIGELDEFEKVLRKASETEESAPSAETLTAAAD